MNKQWIYIFALVLFVSVSDYCFAQEAKVIRDLRQRSSFGIEKELGKKFSIFSEIEAGFEKDISKFGKLYGELGANYSFKKGFKIEAKYRYTINRKNFYTEYNYWHMYALSAEKKFKIEKFRLAYRMQYQNIDDEVLGIVSDVVKEQILKNRFKIQYNLKEYNITPFASTELYLGINLLGTNAKKIKTIMGIEYRYNKQHQFKLYYRNDEELSQISPFNYHTIGLAYNLNL